jgi:hypothetical protein
MPKAVGITALARLTLDVSASTNYASLATLDANNVHQLFRTLAIALAAQLVLTISVLEVISTVLRTVLQDSTEHSVH